MRFKQCGGSITRGQRQIDFENSPQQLCYMHANAVTPDDAKCDITAKQLNPLFQGKIARGRTAWSESMTLTSLILVGLPELKL